MKKFLLLTVFATLLICIDSYATRHRVGYFGTPIHGTDYATVQMANDSIKTAGDTILVFPGSYYATLSKKFVYIGYGYFVASGADSGRQNITGALSFTVTLDSTASGCTFIGLDGISITSVYQNAVNNITVSRCNGSVYFGNDQPSKNWTITESMLSNTGYYNGGGTISNLTINNCYINSMSLNSGPTSGNSGQFNNDILYVGYMNSASFLFTNSVLLYYHSNDVNCVYQNCIATSDQYPIPTGNGNQNITTAAMSSNVFVGYSTQGKYSNDGLWVLKSGSPAIGKGIGGTDCGIFGGKNPYKIAGIPPIPAFYKLTAPSSITGTNPYTITFSVQSNN
jgi:hypothetical protein